MKQKLKIQKRNNGITLMALVITIIVLLILAGITIGTLTGDNGILTKASEAKEATEVASVKEQAQIDILAWQRNKENKNIELNNIIIKTILTGKDYVDGTPGDLSFKTKSGYEILYSDLEVDVRISEIEGVTIPEEFYYAGGTKNEGIVISDVKGDDLDNSKGGNQFVWVPVEDPSKFVRSDWKNWSGTGEPATETVYTEDASKDPTGKYDEMVSSVETNHGFYIGRFEAGNEGGTYNSETQTWEGDNTLVVKKDKTVWNNIPWGAAAGKIGTTGAAYRALNFVQNTYTDKGKEVGVKSTLVYGVQWDAIMRWISEDEELKGYITNSTGKGNYTDADDTNNPALTGANPNYQIKNIYDLAGNVAEITMEDQTYYKAVRGGGFNINPVTRPISHRFQLNLTSKRDFAGFRVALYL